MSVTTKLVFRGSLPLILLDLLISQWVVARLSQMSCSMADTCTARLGTAHLSHALWGRARLKTMSTASRTATPTPLSLSHAHSPQKQSRASRCGVASPSLVTAGYQRGLITARLAPWYPRRRENHMLGSHAVVPLSPSLSRPSTREKSPHWSNHWRLRSKSSNASWSSSTGTSLPSNVWYSGS